MRTRRAAATIAIAVCLVMIAACTATAEPRGRDSRDAVARGYLDALRGNDAGAMLALTNPGVDARSAVGDAITNDGGKALRDVRVSYLDEFGGDYVVALVHGTLVSSGADFETRIPISRIAGRYYLALGQANPSGAEASTAIPTER